MKPKKELTLPLAIIYGILAEMLLVITQFVYLKYYTSQNPDTAFAFTSEYMTFQGFYIFQIIGFFLYSVIVFMVIRRYNVGTIGRIIALLISGAIIELLFYAFIQADYQLAYFYSILDKFVAAVFGFVVYYYSSDDSE